MTNTLIALFGVTVVLVAAIGRVRAITLVEWALGFAIAASVVLVLSPTPIGYAPELSSYRLGGQTSAVYGPRLAHVLFGVSMVALLASIAGRRRTPDEIEHDIEHTTSQS